MKKLIFITVTLLITVPCLSQVTTRIVGDSTKLYQTGGGNNELIIENSTRSLDSAFLQNLRNGRTRFAFAIDSAYYESGALKLRRGGSIISFPILAPSDTVSTLATQYDLTQLDLAASLSSLGSGYDLAVEGTSSVKSLAASNGITADSATEGTVGVKLGGALADNTTINADTNILSVTNVNGFQTTNVQGGYLNFQNSSLDFTVKDAASGATITEQISANLSRIRLRHTASGNTGEVLISEDVTLSAADTTYILNLPTISDTTGYDLVARNRSSQALVKIPSDIVGGSGGGGGDGTVEPAGSNFALAIEGTNLVKDIRGMDGIKLDSATAGTVTIRPDTLSYEDADSIAFSRRIVGWGDSNTEFAGYLERISTLTGRITWNEGISGQTSTQIKNRMIVDSIKKHWSIIIWAGSNNVSSPATVMRDIRQMVDSIPHNRYLILSVHDVSNAGTGFASNDSMHVINDSLELVYGDHFLNIRDSLYESYDPDQPADVTAHTNGKLPPSLMATGGTDPAHMNTAGYYLIAGWIVEHRWHILSGEQYMDKLVYASALSRIAQPINSYTHNRATYNITNHIMWDSASNPVFGSQQYVWNGSSFTASQGYYIGKFALKFNKGTFANGFGPWAGYSNTGNYGNFFGYTAGQNNTGTFANFFGGTAGTNNTGANPSGFGHGALNANTGANVSGLGVGVLSSNTGANATAVGYQNGQLNTGSGYTNMGREGGRYNLGSNHTSFGDRGLYYNNWNNRTHIGTNDILNDYYDDAATEKTFTEASISGNNITITSHGFGANGTKVNLRYTVISGGPISIFTTGSVYQFTVVDANTLSYTGLSSATKPAGTYQLNKDADRSNSSSLGYNARPTKSNQVFLGNTSVTEVATYGKYKGNAPDYSSGGYEMVVWNSTDSTFEKIDTSTFFSAIRATIPGGGGGGGEGINNANVGSGFELLHEGTQEIKTLTAGSNITLDSTSNPGEIIITATGGGGSGTDNENIGSGHWWLHEGTQAIKTAFGGYGITIDSSSNTNGLTFTLDTATVFPAIRATIPEGGGGSGANTALSNLASVAINEALLPGSSNSIALGSSSAMWSDLFLGSGGVINFNNGEVTLTQDVAQQILMKAGSPSTQTIFRINSPDAGDYARLWVDNSSNHIFDHNGTMSFRINNTQHANFSSTLIKWNDQLANMDFQIKGDTDANMFYGDASTDRVGVGTATPAEKLDVNGNVAASGGKVGVSLSNNVTSDSNAGTGEENLITYSLAAGKLATNGDYIEVTAAFLVTSVSNKIIIKFGSTKVVEWTTGNTGTYLVRGTITRTGAATQEAQFSITGEDSGVAITSPTETLSGAITIAGASDASGAGGVTQYNLNVKYYPAN